MKTRFGFTLIEVLVVISIVAVLAGIALPVFAASKEQAKIAVCKQQLHQLQLALSLYRSEHDGDGQYGPATQMGLPPTGAQLMDVLKVPVRILQCSAPPNSVSRSGAVYMITFNDDKPNPEVLTWGQYAREELDQSVVFADMNHGDRTIPMRSPFYPHKGFAVRLSGELFTVNKPGSWGELEWWR
jgi:prepilin-type N-terminal cleavage/methylation domain-containing protein